MKVFIFGREKEAIQPSVLAAGFQVVEKNPDFVISYGGDGALLQAERIFPETPKIILRGSRIAKKAPRLPNKEVLRRIAAGRYSVSDVWKLEAEAETGEAKKLVPPRAKFIALNDIVIHNEDPRHAIRYRLLMNEREVGGEIIGDGVVFATPFGSTGYYRSITDSFFELGIGIAFNNSTEQSDPMVVMEESEIKVVIIRGPAVLYADNGSENMFLDDGDKVLVKKSRETAKIVNVEDMECEICK